jgi:hypothetical protein
VRKRVILPVRSTIGVDVVFAGGAVAPDLGDLTQTELMLGVQCFTVLPFCLPRMGKIGKSLHTSARPTGF